MANLYAPLHPMEHQYIITDDVPEIYDRDAEHPHVIDLAGESYLCQEERGLCIGFYEQSCHFWGVNGTPWNFGHELLPVDFDKILILLNLHIKDFLFWNWRALNHLCMGRSRLRLMATGWTDPKVARPLVSLRCYGEFFAGWWC
jgi:hypothetical protein